MLPLYSTETRLRRSVLNRIEERIRGWYRLIISDSNSRNLFMFLCLNLSFAFVELFYGIWSNSLSLISDSFHMFFDCTGLLAGLIASLITKWRPDDKYSYGYVRAEVLAGFVNGLFLLFIGFFIFSEAVERVFEPPDVHHERLLVVSILGFLVNLVGIFVFHHGGAHHGHSHGGGDHGHSHGSHGSKSGATFQNGELVSLVHDYGGSSSPFTSGHHGHSHADGHGHSHDGGHGHSHGTVTHSHDPVQASDRQIMKGVFLHVLADTLGSVGVIISAVLMRMFGWMIADPICSMCMAFLIAISVLPLLRESTSILMMRSPRSLDHVLPECYQRVMTIQGVYSIQEPHFWTLCSDVYVGTVKLEVAPNCDAKYVISAAHSVFLQAGVRSVYIQLDFAPV